MRERDILQSMRSLGRIEPDAAAAEAAMLKTRAVLVARTRSRTRWIIMSTGLAATIVIAASVGFFLSTSSERVSAAERLNEVEQMNGAYRGWVHLQSSTAGNNDAGMLHFNTADGTWISDVRHPDGRRQITMYRPSSREEITYDGSSNRIRIGAINENFARNWAAEMKSYPLTLSGMLAAMKKADVPAPLEVTERTEEGLTRFDVTLPQAKRAAAATVPATQPDKSAGPERFTAWADPKSKLIQKISAVVQGETVTATYTYGEPHIKDLYDVGVPRDARVVDVRPAADANAVLDRLAERVRKGFGDYVAVLCEADVDEDGSVEKTVGHILLFARSGENLLANRYSVGATQNPMTKSIAGKLPAGWPDPKLRDVLDVLRDAKPTEFLVLTGDHGWQGFLQDQHSYYTNTLAGKYAQMIPGLVAGQSLPGLIWPTRERLGLFGADAEVKIERFSDDPAHPNLVGIRVNQGIWDARGQPGDPKHTRRVTQLFVIDPARDDVPVRGESGSVAGSGKKENEFEHVYLDYARAGDNGHWYPTRWRATTKSFARNDKEIKSIEESRLRIFPGEKLDATWFIQPALGAK